MRRWRIGIVGGGNISQTHARAVAEIPGAEVAAVFGRNAESVGKLASEFGARGYASLDEFLAHPGLDVVLIGSPSGMHSEQGRAAARAGIHVLVEKPLDIGTRRVDELIEECDRAGVKLGVFFQDRMAPDLAWLDRLMRGGGLGTPILASARVKWHRPPEYYASSRWRGTWELDGGGALMNQGIHTLDLLLWTFGDVARVSAQTRTALHPIQVEDTAVGVLAFANGAVGTFEATTAAYPGYPRRVELTGTAGTVIVEADRVVAVDLRDPPAEPLPGSGGTANASATTATVADASGHRRVLEDFLDAIETGREPRCGGAEGRRSIALAEAFYRSARGGGAPVDVLTWI